MFLHVRTHSVLLKWIVFILFQFNIEIFDQMTLEFSFFHNFCFVSFVLKKNNNTTKNKNSNISFQQVIF